MKFFNYNYCKICPRSCGAKRNANETGFCLSGNDLNIASISIHHGEEPPISGEHGICNIFFAGCNMRCIYCQNYQISRSGKKSSKSYEKIEDVLKFIEQARRSKCRGIGFVSPSHSIPAMFDIMNTVREKKWNDAIFVYNTNSYDKKEVVEILEGKIEVYLPDFKYADEELSIKLSSAPKYPSIALKAIKEMYRQKGAGIKLSKEGVAESGLIVRHLVLPGHVENSKKCLRILAEEISNELHISLMSQYHPTPQTKDNPIFNRDLRRDEYEEVLEEMEQLGFKNGWIQSLESRDNYNPDFSKEEPFR
ncbi:MAG: hypothetical protein AUJ18_07270 [Candidatus Hydrogenedentes bacterium CG1_02_42_14]|nr:MAG: hypothetical protein AUJ18_07270 [Candidatus Hydrogenedentes bacterium CG1_02_42_14]